MIRSRKIYRNRCIQYWIWIEIFLVCFSGILIDLCKFPRVMKFFPDLITAVLVLDFLNKKNRYLKIKGKDSVITIFVLSFMVCSLFWGLFSTESPILLLWGARNTFRFLLFYICVIHSFSLDDVNKLLKYINPFLVINFILCLCEYFVLGYSGDNIGGTFGVSSGCNAPLNVLIAMATIYNVVCVVQKRSNMLESLLYIALCAGIAGMAELKVYVVEVILVVCIVGLFSKGITKKIVLILIGVLFAFMSIRLIETLIPGWEGFFTLENMYKMISSTEGYNNEGDLNRLTSISVLNETFFSNTTNYWGLGLGNCEYSDNFSWLNSEFYKENGYLHYAWFSVAKIYLELGWFGIGCHVFIWGHAYQISLKNVKDKEIKFIVSTLSAFSLFFFFYNFTMNLDVAYMIYAFLAMSYIWLKDREINKIQ